MNTSLPIASPRSLIRRLVCAATLGLLAACAAVPVIDPGSVRVDGMVDRPRSFTAAELAALPAVSQTASSAAGGSAPSRAYTGASVWQLLGLAQVQRDPSRHGEVLDRYVLATGSDGYRVVFAIGELNPDFGNQQSLVSYAETGEASPGRGASGGLRLTAPGDVKAGRYVRGLVRLSVLASGAHAVGSGGGPSTEVSISGRVRQAARLDVDALRTRPAVDVRAGGRVYRGASLWALLGDAGMASEGKNPSVTRYLVATGTDGYQALVALAEIDPAFGHRETIVAYEVDGQPLGKSGALRLIVGGDGKMGRSVSNLASIELLVAGGADR